MDYAKIYEDFYSKYYTKTEGLIKSYFIKCKSEKRPFGHAIYKIRIHLADTILKKQDILDYNALKSAHQIFVHRFSAYESDEIQSIFANEIKIAFNKISSADLPKDYNYIKFIKDVASLTIINEILRLLQNNSPLFDRFYNLNDYQKFEIKEYGDILERTAIYIEIDSRIYPLIEDNKSEITNLENTLYEDKKTFKIALKFATGEAQELYRAKKHLNGSFKIICLELGFKETDRPYFSETINDNNSDKNLLKNFPLMQYVFKYCNAREIKLCDDFLTKMKELEEN